MEHDVCNVVYLDRRASETKVWTKYNAQSRASPESTLGENLFQTKEISTPAQEVEQTVKALLSLFPRVSVHTKSTSCLAEIRSTYDSKLEQSCTLLLIDIPSEDESSHRPPSGLVRTPSPTSGEGMEMGFFANADLYGMDFLLHVASEIQSRTIPHLVLPIAVLSGFNTQTNSRDQTLNPFSNPERTKVERFAAKEPISKVRYFDAGAADILISPATIDRIQGLPAHAHWIKSESKRRRSSCFPPTSHGKKTSWVGTREDKPYTQLKEAMVSELMNHICDPDYEEAAVDNKSLYVDPSRHDFIADSFGSWSFSAHEFSDDELLYGIFLVLEHTLSIPELEPWRMDKDDLLSFLIATRRVYNSSVLYHNFRHACDVTQATFHFLTEMGAIPSFPVGRPRKESQYSPLAKLIDPFHALLLLISAIGHDVGHPGVNNGFLVTVNAPLAQLYNDRSVLESFHCAAYSQILRRYWKTAFADKSMRRLMINSILATDMGLHADYMSKMETLQKTYESDVNIDTWSDKTKNETRELLCCLLIKCADICNIARKFDVASEWAGILIDEFYAQGQIEQDLNVPSALFGGPPDPTSLLQKCQSQIGFMNVFGYKLFGGVTKLLPSMQFTVNEIDINKDIWQSKMKSASESTERANEEITPATDEKRSYEKESSRSDMSEMRPHLKVTTIHQHSSVQPGRRGSGGIANSFAALPPRTSKDARRSSLPAIVADLNKRRSSASGDEARRHHIFKYLFCCGSPRSPPPELETLSVPRIDDDGSPVSMPKQNEATRHDSAAKEEIVGHREKSV